MKYVAYVILLVVFVLVSAHLEHEAALGGYLQGCKDVIRDIKRDGELIPDYYIQIYCHSLGNRYVKNK